MCFLINLVKNFRQHKIAKCNICGKITIFISYDISKARGDFICIFCGSFSRKRHVAKIINKIYEYEFISKIPKKSQIKIYNTDINDSFDKVLSHYDGFIYGARYRE